MRYVHETGTVVDSNSTTTVLASSGIFTGDTFECQAYASMVVAVKTDQDGTLYMEFSPDGTNWDSSLTFTVYAGVNEVHRLTVTRRYYRTRFLNEGNDQTYFRLQTLAGDYSPLTSALNSTIQQDNDTLAVRPLDFNITVAKGFYQNTQNTIKDGINFDVRSGNVPQDIWSNGGTYTGFPTGTVEAGEIVVAGADTGTVYYSYLASPTSTDYVFGSKAIDGAATYSLGHNIWRCNFAYFVSASATAFNAGNITIRNVTTTTNIFCVIQAGYSQSYCAAYTVPYGSNIFLDRTSSVVAGSTSTSLDGHFWYRAYEESPRLRFPFNVQFGQLYFDDIDYLIRIPAQTDLMPRIIASSSATTAKVEFTYRFIKIKG